MEKYKQKKYKTEYKCPRCGSVIYKTRLGGLWCLKCDEKFDKDCLKPEEDPLLKGLDSDM